LTRFRFIGLDLAPPKVGTFCDDAIVTCTGQKVTCIISFMCNEIAYTVIFCFVRKISKIGAIKLDFHWRSVPDPAGGAYSDSSRPPTGFQGPVSKGRENKKTERRGKGNERRDGEGSKENGRVGRGRRE